MVDSNGKHLIDSSIEIEYLQLAIVQHCVKSETGVLKNIACFYN